MSRLSLFNSPLLLGFDEFERQLDRITKSASDVYPPYNVEQLGDNRIRITLALAGFSPEDLAIEVEDRQLKVSGKQQDEPNRKYLHRGIATRQFQRSFVLAEGIEVERAWMDQGLLHVDLLRRQVEPRVRRVSIEGTTASGETKPSGAASKAAE